MATLCFVAACSASAQTLPGPASGGWFVLMGINPEGGKTHGSGMSSYYQPRCTAVVLPSSRSNKPTFGSIRISKQFGPYVQREDAFAALTAAGWQCTADEYGTCEDCGGYMCTADTGCQ
jgi:hypothetical protein